MGIESKVTAFCCEHSAYQLAETIKEDITINLDIVKLPCSGKIEVADILKAMENGAKGIIVMGCHEDSCQFIRGNIRARKRIDYVQKILTEIGIEKERVIFFPVANVEGDRIRQAIVEMEERIEKLGNSLKDK